MDGDDRCQHSGHVERDLRAGASLRDFGLRRLGQQTLDDERGRNERFDPREDRTAGGHNGSDSGARNSTALRSRLYASRHAALRGIVKALTHLRVAGRKRGAGIRSISSRERARRETKVKTAAHSLRVRRRFSLDPIIPAHVARHVPVKAQGSP